MRRRDAGDRVVVMQHDGWSIARPPLRPPRYETPCGEPRSFLSTTNLTSCSTSIPEQTIEGGHGRVETLCGPRLEANLAFMPVEFDVTPGHSRYRRSTWHFSKASRNDAAGSGLQACLRARGGWRLRILCSETVNGNVYHQSLDWSDMVVSTALYNAGRGRVLTLRHPHPNGDLHSSIGMKPHDFSGTFAVSIY